MEPKVRSVFWNRAQLFFRPRKSEQLKIPMEVHPPRSYLQMGIDKNLPVLIPLLILIGCTLNEPFVNQCGCFCCTIAALACFFLSVSVWQQSLFFAVYLGIHWQQCNVMPRKALLCSDHCYLWLNWCNFMTRHKVRVCLSTEFVVIYWFE